MYALCIYNALDVKLLCIWNMLMCIWDICFYIFYYVNIFIFMLFEFSLVILFALLFIGLQWNVKFRHFRFECTTCVARSLPLVDRWSQMCYCKCRSGTWLSLWCCSTDFIINSVALFWNNLNYCSYVNIHLGVRCHGRLWCQSCRRSVMLKLYFFPNESSISG